MDAPIQHCTVSQLLRRAARRFGASESVASPERGVRWSFAELDRRADAVARACVAAGLRPGDRAVVWAINLPEWVALQYGLARAGVVLVTANTSFKTKEIAFILGKSRARAVFFGRGARDNDFTRALAELSASELPCLAMKIGLDGAGLAGSMSLDAFLANGERVSTDQLDRVENGLDRDDVINMQYTSGTTGFPKGVMLSHRNIVQNAAAIAPVLGIGPTDRLCLAVPLFHCFGCVIGTLVSHGSGAAMVLNDLFSPEPILDTIEAERCTFLYGVPTMYAAELQAHRRRRRDLTSLRVGVMAGAACPEALMRAVAAEFPLPGQVIAYGLTEASPGVTLSRPDDSIDVRATTIGRALPGVEVRVVDPVTGDRLPVGARGEIWTRGDHVMQGYDGEPESTRAAITPDGWLRTGDLAEETSDGCYRIVGRIKELIIRGGENISPAEVEAVLCDHDSVCDAAVFAIHSDFFGEEVAAAVRVDPAAPPTEKELQVHVGSRLSKHKVPVKILFLDQFPLTGSGKVQRFRLRELAEATPHPSSND